MNGESVHSSCTFIEQIVHIAAVKKERISLCAIVLIVCAKVEVYSKGSVLLYLDWYGVSPLWLCISEEELFATGRIPVFIDSPFARLTREGRLCINSLSWMMKK